MGGKALADILLGKVSPSGKLPVTFYGNADLLPEFTDYSMKNRTYRFAENNILYPFGYGLTYAHFECGAIDFKRSGETCRIECEVKNTGSYDSENVFQLYIKSFSENAVRNYSLKGFRRVFVKSGESKLIELEIPIEAFADIDENGNSVIYGGKYEIFCGFSQPDSISYMLSGEKASSMEVII